jgi:hypothetical protein
VSKRLDYNQIAPNGVKALGGVYGYVMQSGLPAELVDLVYLRVSQINNRMAISFRNTPRAALEAPSGQPEQRRGSRP